MSLSRFARLPAKNRRSPGVFRSAVPLRSFSTASVPEEADIVIVGGGSIGTSVLYHLAKRGLGSSAVLLEKAQLTAGTTWHSAGLHWRLRPNDVEIQLLDVSRELCKDGGELERETESKVWTANGGLFLASTPERLDEYKRLKTVGLFYGIESELVSPAQAKELYPLMNVDDLFGALYSPGDGLIDPSGVAMAYAKGAKKLGAKVVEGVHVTGVDVENGKVTGVQTSAGRIKTKLVVNCAGAWGRKLGELAGVKVPLAAFRHAYVVTDEIPGLGFVPNIRDHDLSVYMKYQGKCLAIGGYEPNPIHWDVQDNFEFGLFDLDWDVFGFNIEGHMKRVPAVENVGIAHTVCGPESFTPDHKPLLGPSEVDGFWLCCGFNSAGIMMSGGCGRELARWIDVGNTELDMFGYDVARFHRSYSNDVKWIVDRSHEAYAKNYSIVFPHDQPLAGRNVRHTPFHEKLIANGCFHQEILGWERPVYFVPEEARKGESTGAKPYDYYGYYPEKCEQHASHLYAELLKHEYSFQWPESMPHVKAEHEACRNGVVAFDMSAFGKIELSGEDAQAAVDWLATNRTDKGPGTCVYTMMCDSEGKVQSDLTVNCLTPERFYLVTPGASSQHDWDWIRREVSRKGFDVQMQDVTRDWAVLSVQGPKSRRLLEAMFERVGGGTSLSDGDFPFATLQEVPFGSDGVHIRMLRLTFAGELGWELHVPKVHASDVYDAVFSAGAEFGVKNGGYGALESLSLEKGYRHWHVDVRMDDTPLEAGMTWVCKLKTNTPFLGREALEAQRAAGLKKRLCYVKPNEDVPIFGLEALLRNGEPVGYLRRAGYAFSLKTPLGIAYVHAPEELATVTPEWIKREDVKWELEVMGRRVPVTVSLGTPFDPKNLRVKGQYD